MAIYPAVWSLQVLKPGPLNGALHGLGDPSPFCLIIFNQLFLWCGWCIIPSYSLTSPSLANVHLLSAKISSFLQLFFIKIFRKPYWLYYRLPTTEKPSPSHSECRLPTEAIAFIPPLNWLLAHISMYRLSMRVWAAMMYLQWTRGTLCTQSCCSPTMLDLRRSGKERGITDTNISFKKHTHNLSFSTVLYFWGG